MSTRCLVGYRDKDTVHYIYCHHDGYVEEPGVGYTLFNYYKDLNKIKDLISRGSTSDIAPNVKDCEFYNEEGWGEKTVPVANYGFNCQDDAEYIYLFQNNEWYVLYVDYDTDRNNIEKVEYLLNKPEDDEEDIPTWDSILDKVYN